MKGCTQLDGRKGGQEWQCTDRGKVKWRSLYNNLIMLNMDTEDGLFSQQDQTGDALNIFNGFIRFRYGSVPV